MKHSLIVALLMLASPAAAETITGRASVINGDTIEIRGTRFRLQGVDTPESAQTCQDAAAKSYRCGQKASLALADKIGQGNVACDVVDTDRYGRSVAVCRLGAEDLNGWLVAQGHGMAYRRYSTAYVAQEDAAKIAKRRDLGRSVHGAVGLAQGRASDGHGHGRTGWSGWADPGAEDAPCYRGIRRMRDQGQHQ